MHSSVSPCCQAVIRAICAGEDLLVASADKPFRFPATFTFVVRSFTVLGKRHHPIKLCCALTAVLSYIKCSMVSIGGSLGRVQPVQDKFSHFVCQKHAMVPADGIGKGLDPRFDISEIAAPYARGLLLEGNPQYAALAKDFRRRVGLQVHCCCCWCHAGRSHPVLKCSCLIFECCTGSVSSAAQMGL